MEFRQPQLTEENERLRAHGPSAVPNSLESESVIGLGELSGSTDLGGDAMVSALCAPAGTHAGSSSRCSSSSDSSGQDKAQSKSSVPPAAASPAQPKAEAGAGKRAQASSSTASRAGRVRRLMWRSKKRRKAQRTRPKCCQHDRHAGCMQRGEAWICFMNSPWHCRRKLASRDGDACGAVKLLKSCISGGTGCRM